MESKKKSKSKVKKLSKAFPEYLRKREHGLRQNDVPYHRNSLPYQQSYLPYQRHNTRFMIMNNLFRAHKIPINLSVNSKIISSQWIDNREVLCGTEKDELMIYNVKLRKFRQIPLIRGCIDVDPDKQSCVHTIQINPYRSVLITNAYNFDEIAVYKLPTLDPMCTLGGIHKEFICDTVWLNNESFVSASKDKVVLWKFEKSSFDDDGLLLPLVKPSVTPLIVRDTQAQKLTFIQHKKLLISISLDKRLTVWDPEILKPTRLYGLDSHVGCIASQKGSSICVVGCIRGITLLDPRTYRLSNMCNFNVRRRPYGIKSLSLRDHIVTLGRENGTIKFFDVRSGSISKFSKNVGMICPYRNSDTQSLENNASSTQRQAIFTHCYDLLGTRLFCAGGPPGNISGSYAGLCL